MKVMFIYSTDNAFFEKKLYSSLEHIAFGISYISAVLKKNNYETNLVVLSSQKNVKNNYARLNKYINELKPKLLLFSAVSSQYPFIKQIATLVKNDYPEIFILIGGAHATVSPNELITGPFNGLCIGEGEYAVLELANAIKANKSPQGIQNIWLKHNDYIEKNDIRPFLQKLDELPFPDRDMWLPWVSNDSGSRLSVLLGRGCPYNCTYCSNHVFKQLAEGKYVRTRSVTNILEEIRYLIKQYPVCEHIYLEVEDILNNKIWAEDLMRNLVKLNENFTRKIKFSCNYRVTPLKPDNKFFELLKLANFVSINIGLESGSEKVRKNILSRKYSNENFLETVRMAKQNGLKVYIYNLIGLPRETWADYLATVEVNKKCQPDGTYNSIFFPYPGTKLYNVCIEQNLLPTKLDLNRERRHSVLKMKQFSKLQIQWAYYTFEYRIYNKLKSRLFLLIKMLHLFIISHKLTYSIFNTLISLPLLKQIWKFIKR